VLRRQDKLVLKMVDGTRTVREVIQAAGVKFEQGLHSLAWLAKTGFVYSSQTVYEELDRQADRLALFVDLFSDSKHGLEFWESQVQELAANNPELGRIAPGVRWDGLVPKITEPLPSPQEVKDYFLNLFVALYDRAEQIFGPEKVLAKRILLDVRP